MADLATRIEGARAQVNGKTVKFLPNLCNIVIPGATIPDGFGGETETDPVIHLNQRCKIDPLNRNDQAIGGAQLTNQTNVIVMGINAITKKIKAHYQIVVPAHHGQDEQVFENPIVLLGSFDMLLKVAAAVKK